MFLATVSILGDGDVTTAQSVDLTAFTNVGRILVENISDFAGLGFDNFNFVSAGDVSEVPIPPAVLLFAMGLLGLRAAHK